jgi:VWFA-related protein
LNRKTLFGSFALILLLGLPIIHGCSATPPAGGAVHPANGATPANTAAVAAAPSPSLDLCRPPDLPPADLRAKPGYTQLRVMVTDADGSPVSGLKQTDFTVRAGGKTYPIAYFREETPGDTPVSIVSVSDVSSTMYNKTFVSDRNDLIKSRVAVMDPVRQLNVCDEMAVVTVGGTNLQENGPTLGPVTYLQPFTTDLETAASRTFTIQPSGPETLPDGMKMALAAIAESHYANRAMVVLTDDLDAKAMEQSEEILRAVPKGSFSLWVIGIGDPDAGGSSLTGARGMNRDAITQLAQAGGGHALFAQAVANDKGASLGAAISTITDSVARGYTIGAVVPGSTTPSTVALTHRPGATVSTSVVSPALLTAELQLSEPPKPCLAGSRVPESIKSQKGFSLLRVSVASADNKPTEGLTQSDFAASCNGGSCPIVYFQEGCGSKSVMVAIDTSGSMEPKLETVKSDVGSLFTELAPGDAVGLIAFSNRPYLLQPLATPRIAQAKLYMLHAFGQTALYDSVADSIRLLANHKGQKVLVLITDGLDNTSQSSLDSVLKQLKRTGVVVYAIGIGYPGGKADNSKIAIGPFLLGGNADGMDISPLQAMAQASGCESFSVPPFNAEGSAPFDGAITKILNKLNSGTGYEIGVIAGEGKTPVVLSVPKQPGLVVNASEALSTTGG